MKVLCPSCERLVELVDLRVERGGLVARCPACGAEQRQELPARPVTVPPAKAAAKKESSSKKESGKKRAATKAAAKPPPTPAVADDEENDEGPTIILLTPSSQAVPLAVAPPGTADVPRPAEVARFESARPPAIAPVTPPAEAAPLPRKVVDAEFAQLLNHLGDVQPSSAPAALRPRPTGSNAVIPPAQAGVARGSTIQIPPGYCPKCITLRTREALICPACGLVFANFRAEEHQPSAALESAWRGLEDRWSRQEEHEKFLQMAFNMDELAKAGRLYRIRLATTADDVQAKAALESMVRMASTAAAAASKTDPAEFQRHRRKVLAVSAMLFFVIPIAALLVNFLLRAH